MLKQIFLYALLVFVANSGCIHDSIVQDTQELFYDDQLSGRKLQSSEIGPLRIHLDLEYGIFQEFKPLFDKIMGISSNFFHNFLKVPQMHRLFYPNIPHPQCNNQSIPLKYIDNGINQGVDADFGLIVRVVYDDTDFKWLASSLHCAQLQSTKRPIWAVINWNIYELYALFQDQVDTLQFNQMISIAIHEITHSLVFSASLYKWYQGELNQAPFNKFATSAQILQALNSHFNCSQAQGIAFEDSNGESSHWQKQIVGNQIMGAVYEKSSYFGQFTVFIFEYSGWYYEVDRTYIEPTAWGKNKGCPFLSKQCKFQEFCSQQQADQKQLDCDWEGIGIGICKKDRMTSNCNRFLTTPSLCIDPNYLKTIPYNVMAAQQPGKYAKCFKGDLRKAGQFNSKLKNRCYQALCLADDKFILLKIQDKRYLCYYPGYLIKSPPGFIGILQCPSNFDRICKSKKQCPYNCGDSGACINGFCLCMSKEALTPTCFEDQEFQQTSQQRWARIIGSLDCQKIGFIFDPITAECQLCSQILGCVQCDQKGCLVCDDGSEPENGHCLNQK